MDQAQAVKPERQAFYDKISHHEMAPLWEVLKGLVPPEPKPQAVPYVWHYNEIRHLLLEAGALLTAKEAERRVLVLENPSYRGQSRITNTLYAGIQLIMPGEIAPAHRHTQSALRFILEGDGAYTSVDGEKTFMKEGDFVITPAWAWHDHGNTTDKPMMWLDGLDVPMASYFDIGFMEHFNDEQYPEQRPAGDALARWGSGLMPEGQEHGSITSPVFNYPYARTRDTLEILRRTGEWDRHLGLRLRYVNPMDGGWAMPTMATWMSLWPKDFGTQPYRSTDGSVFVVVEGTGRSVIGGKTIEWGPRDVFVVPNWTWATHSAAEDAVVFTMSDRSAQEKLGFWREQRGNA